MVRSGTRRRIGRQAQALLRLSTFAGMGVAAVFATHALLSWTPAQATLLADGGAGAPGLDSDGDGLPDQVEGQFGSAQTAGVDADGDGVPDMVEVLFGTQPGSASSAPSPFDISQPKARVMGFIESGQFHIQVAVYLPTGNLSTLNGIGGMMIIPEFFTGEGGTLLPAYLDLNPLIYGGAVSMQRYANGTGVVTSDSWLPLEYVPLFSAQGSTETQFTIAFAAWVSGVKVSDVEFFTTTGGNDPSSLAELQILANGGVGGFRPLIPPVPGSGWQSDSACVLTYGVVGVEPGGVLIFETTSSGCQPFAGTTCDPAGCAAQVGKLFKTLDPTSLGG